MRCVECETSTNILYDDVRNPPLDEHPCLCPDCYSVSLDEQIETVERELEALEGAKKLFPF